MKNIGQMYQLLLITSVDNFKNFTYGFFLKQIEINQRILFKIIVVR